MSESTLQTAAVPEPKIVEPPPPTRTPRRALQPRYAWPAGALLLALFSFGLIHWTQTRPGYDPYGWLIWGYQTLHGSLDLGGAPSWKPLTWLFDVPFSLTGHTVSLWLWMTTAVTLAFAGGIFAGRIAHRLCLRAGFSPRAALVGGLFSGVCLLGIQDYMHYVLSVQSDPVIVTFCLMAIDAHLCGRPRLAFTLAVLASLGRPEAWPFTGLYAIWAWRRFPGMRVMIVAGLAVIPALWFGVPWITNGRPLVAGQLALASPRELHQNKIIGTLHRFTALHYLPVQLLSLVTVAFAWVRRDRLLLILAGGAVGWIIVELAFVLHGWPGVPRYLFEPAGVMIVLAGVAVGWLVHEAPGLVSRRVRAPAWSGLLVVGLISLILVPGALTRLRAERKDLRHERDRTVTIQRLGDTVAAVGGAARLRACGLRPVSTVEYVSILAWLLNRNDGTVGHRPLHELHLKHGSAFFILLHSGWSVLPWHIPATAPASCAGLKTTLLFTRHHPHGVLVRYIPGSLR